LIKKKEEKIMSDEKDLKKGNGEKESRNEDKDETVEGYAFCSSVKQKCLNDCIGGEPSLSYLK